MIFRAAAIILFSLSGVKPSQIRSQRHLSYDKDAGYAPAPQGVFRSTTERRNLMDNELGDAAALFSGPLETVAENVEFKWLESPLWSENGKYLLFSDVKWIDAKNHTCGMIWRYDDNQGVTKFLPCSGTAGPGENPSNIADLVEAGSNGLHWGWKGDDDLLICQHGKQRIVRINVNDVNKNGEIDASKVSVVVEGYNGKKMNSPNDLVLVDNTLYFTDPPFGQQLFSSGDDAVPKAFASTPQGTIGVYSVTGDPGTKVADPELIIDFGTRNPWEGPNGIAINKNGDIMLAITNFKDPRFEIYSNTCAGGISASPKRLESKERIKGTNSGFPALSDGVTYSPELDILFGNGPGGVYIYHGTTYKLLGFLRTDDLSSNTVVGGGYLWLTVNNKLMRIQLADDPSTPTSSAVKKLAIHFSLLFCSVVFFWVHSMF